MLSPKKARLLLPLLLFSILVVSPADTLASGAATSAINVAKTFQDHIDRNQFDQAARLVTEDAEIFTPLEKKTKEQFLHKLQSSANRPVWGACAVGDHDRQCIAQGTRKFGFIKVKLKRVMEINEENKIHKITVAKQW